MIELALEYLSGVFSYKLIVLCTCTPKFRDLRLMFDLGELLICAPGLVLDLHDASLQNQPGRRSHQSN